MASLVSGVAKLNPFKKSVREDDDEDKGEQIDPGSVAGGGHSARQTAITKTQLRISPALKSFLVNQNVISEQDAAVKSDHLSEPLKALVDKPHINVPSSVTDRSHPLPDYFHLLKPQYLSHWATAIWHIKCCSIRNSARSWGTLC